MNAGSLLLGAFDGFLIGLLAVGLVLVYRASRFLNLAHGQLGALPALLLAKLVIDRGWPYWPSLVLCVAVGAATGIAVERWLVARLRARTRSTVSALLFTVGITQLLLFLMVIPGLQPDAVELVGEGYPLPFDLSFEFDGVKFGGQYIAVLLFGPLVVVGLAVFLRRSVYGKMIRATASNPDAAQLCGVDPKVVAAITWGAAGALSTFSAILAAPSVSATGIGALGPAQLFLAFGAAAFGSFVSIPWAVGGGVAIGMVTQLALFETSDAGIAQLAVFVLVLGVVLARGRSIAAVFAAGGAAAEDLPPPRVPPAVRERLVVSRRRSLLVGGALFLAVVAPLLPPLSAEGARFQLSLILVYAAIGVSLTLLIGWAGQLSLGHMAVVGVGAFVAGRQAAEGRSFVELLVIGGLLGAAVMVVIGIPALRVRGLTLAVTTLGLGVVASTWLFQADWFTGSPTGFVYLDGPIAPWPGFDVEGTLSTYWTVLATLAGIATLAGRLRRSNPGRLIVAVRDDERLAASHGVSPATTKLAALAVSGGLAGMAGVLWADTWQTVSPAQFPPELSIAVLAIPVLGGLGSVSGAIAAAVVLYFPTLFWSTYLDNVLGDAAQTGFQLLFSGVNVLIVLLLFPTGLAGAGQRLWERFLRRVDGEVHDRAPALGASRLVADDVHLSFGGVAALQGASIEIGHGEIVGLIGPNGAGKSTLLNVLSGVHRAHAGAVRLDGVDVSREPPEGRAALGLGRSFQAATLFPGLTVKESVQAVLGARRHVGVLSAMVGLRRARQAERDTDDRAGELLARTGLTEWAGSLTADLSTGTRRICDLTLQLAAEPSVLLLDEPTAGVAQRDAEAFGPLLRRIRDELDCSIVVVEHDMPLLMGLCDRVYALVEGRVIAEGTPEEIRNDPAVIASYLGTDTVAVERSGART
jgi:ABC-type branched-subunit amino acid transport system ATPase component/ABC-type branched-subunit amino acid transport system permease subunit